MWKTSRVVAACTLAASLCLGGIGPAVGAASAPADVDAFAQRANEWSQQLHSIYEVRARYTWPQAIRLARTMGTADSQFVEWMDANPAIECYQPVQAKMRTRVVKHAAIVRGFARLVKDQRFDEATEAWRFGTQQYLNTYKWMNQLLVVC